MVKAMDSSSRKILVSGSSRKEGLDDKVKKSLHCSTAEGTFNAAASSIFDTYLIPFAMALGATSGEIGILTAVQNLANTLSQIPGAILGDYYSRKAIWMLSQVVGRIIFWIPILLLAVFNVQGAIIALIIFVGIQTFIIGLRAPAWASLMGDLVPASIRGRYFGNRNMITGLAGIAMTLGAGVIVSIYGFSEIFFIYIILGIIAAPIFMKMYEPPAKKTFHYKFRISIHPSQWSKTIATNKSLSIFTIYLFIMNFAILVASPFYTVYMLKDLHIGYFIFSVITILGALAHIVTFKYWGKITDRYGSRKTFIVASAFGIFVPLLWAFVSDPITASLVIIYDGVIFSGINQVAFNYLLDITPSDRRSQYVANHNFFVGMGVVFGALSGGILATMFDGQTFLVFAGLQIVFLASFVIRIFAVALLPKISEIDVKHMKGTPIRDVFWQAMAVGPLKGINNTLHYTFKQPYELEKGFKNNVKKIQYKIKMKTS